MNERIITFTKKGLRILCFAMLGILAAGVFALIFAVAVKLLWNWIMPEIFGLVQIDYLQALGLVVLARLLIGGWHKGHGERSVENGHDHLHRFLKSDLEKIPPEIRMHKKSFDEFWKAEGRDSFKKYSGGSKKSGADEEL